MWDPADAARRAAAASAATRSITAPAGRLRVHLANHPRDGYAVVHTVDAESPLAGELFPGDTICAVDGEPRSDKCRTW